MSGGTVWATNFWSADFWAVGFWEGDSASQPQVHAILMNNRNKNISICDIHGLVTISDMNKNITISFDTNKSTSIN